MKIAGVIFCVEPLDPPRGRNPSPGWKRLLFLILVAAGLRNPEALAQNSPTNSPAARPAGRAAADSNESQVIEEESDRAREEAAQRNARRIVPTLLRGPYLQCGTPDSVVVRWRTDKASPSLVRFGLGETNLKFSARTRGLHTDHAVVLTNLAADTRYFYALATNMLSGTNTLNLTNNVAATNSSASISNTNPPTGTNRPAGSGRTGGRNNANAANRNTPAPRNIFNTNTVPVATNSFVTAPRPGTPKPTRVWVLGDPGTRQPPQRAVRDGFFKFNGDRHIDLWLLLGDNAYDAGTDTEYQGSIFLAYIDLLRRSVLWPSLGNHDGDSVSSPAQAGAYFDIFTLPTQAQAGGVMSGTEAYYAYDYANVHFVVLDSYDSDRSTNGLMSRWLKADLAASRQTWTVAYWHHPPHTKASHDSDDDRDGDARSREMRQNILPVLEASGVDLALCGHSHAYERTALLDGYYGRSTNFTRAFVKDPGDGCEDTGSPYRKTSAGPAAHEGTVYVVAGSSGQISGIRSVHPAMLVSLNVAGSVALDFNGPRLDVTFVDTNGVRRDYFTIEKGVRPAFLAARNENVKPPARGAQLLRTEMSSPEARSLTRLAAQFDPAANLDAANVATRLHSSERVAMLKLYRTTTNVALKTRLTWPLAALADAEIARALAGTVTNKILDRVISPAEEQLRLTTVRALGLVGSRYEPTLDFLRKGLSADWWYFRTNYVAARPLEQSAADLTSAAIAGLALSGRIEAIDLLARGRVKYAEFTAGEPEVLVRNYANEFAVATNALVRTLHLSPIEWRRRVVTEELARLPAR